MNVAAEGAGASSGIRRGLKRVGMVLDAPFPPDARVEREAVALTRAGYEVHLLCMAKPDGDESELRDEFYRGFYVHRVNPQAVRDPILGGLKYSGLIKNIFREFWAVDTVWQTLIERFVRSYDIQVLHIHDLRLVPTGLSVADKRRLPLVADLHENYPALMQMMKGKHNPRAGERQRKKWEEIEYRAVHAADRVITVIEEAKERLLLKGVPPEKILVLPNTVDADKFQQAAVDNEIVRQFKPNFLLTYVGHLNAAHRGIQTVIGAMSILKDEIPELAFVGAGAIREPYYKELEPMIRDYGLTSRVHFTGWLDETEFVPYIVASDICLIPHVATDHTNSTFPNKAYLYHLYRKPVVASNCVPLQRYLEDVKGGLCFESGNAQMLAEQIRKLYHDTALRRELGNNGYQAVTSHYNWNVTANDLVRMYDGLTGNVPIAGAGHREKSLT